jgi:hypothetical protein
MYLNDNILLTDKGKIKTLKLVHFSLRSESIMIILKDVPGNFFRRGSIFLLSHIQTHLFHMIIILVIII